MTVKEFYEACKGVGEAKWGIHKGVIIGYDINVADEKIDEERLQFIFDINGGELVGELPLFELHIGLFWGDPTPETLAKYLKK